MAQKTETKSENPYQSPCAETSSVRTRIGVRWGMLSLVTGLVSLGTGCVLPFFDLTGQWRPATLVFLPTLFISPPGLVFGLVGQQSKSKRRAAVAGIVLNGIAFSMMVQMMVFTPR